MVFHISYYPIVFSLALFAVSTYILFKYSPNILSHVAMSLIKTVGLAVCAGIAIFLFAKWGSIFLNIIFALCIITISAISATLKTKQGLKACFLPIMAGISATTIIALCCILPFISGNRPAIDATIIIPATGILAGCLNENMAKSVSAYYSGLRHHAQLYYYLLGNGATHSEAMAYLRKRAIEKAAMPQLARVSATVLFTSPTILLSMVLSGVDVVDALILQIFISIATLCTSVISTFIAVIVAQKYSIDGYCRLKSH